jgi:hypothetical protein
MTPVGPARRSIRCTAAAESTLRKCSNIHRESEQVSVLVEDVVGIQEVDNGSVQHSLRLGLHTRGRR